MIDSPDKGWARPSDQALAVPAKPASGLVASRFDPSRTEKLCGFLDSLWRPTPAQQWLERAAEQLERERGA
jgi:hypothetical protein